MRYWTEYKTIPLITIDVPHPLHAVGLKQKVCEKKGFKFSWNYIYIYKSVIRVLYQWFLYIHIWKLYWTDRCMSSFAGPWFALMDGCIYYRFNKCCYRINEQFVNPKKRLRGPIKLHSEDRVTYSNLKNGSYLTAVWNRHRETETDCDSV